VELYRRNIHQGNLHWNDKGLGPAGPCQGESNGGMYVRAGFGRLQRALTILGAPYGQGKQGSGEDGIDLCREGLEKERKVPEPVEKTLECTNEKRETFT